MASQRMREQMDEAVDDICPMPYTEQGISMLSAILRSDVAINVSIAVKVNSEQLLFNWQLGRDLGYTSGCSQLRLSCTKPIRIEYESVKEKTISEIALLTR